MLILYKLGIRIYYLLILIASAGNEKAKQWIRGRRGWKKELHTKFSKQDSVIWFHCASLGEFEQGRPLMERVRKDFPHYKILLSFFSPSGFEKRKDFPGADHVMYLPLDTARNARKLLDMISIEKVFFIKYEFWYHILRGLYNNGIPVFLASGNFRSDQLFFKWYGSWYRKFLHFFRHIFVQNTASAALLQGIGIQHTSVAGDTRFERVIKIARDVKPAPNLQAFAKDASVIVAGSTWDRDEDLLFEIYKALEGKYKWIIAPHEPTERNMQRLARQFEKSVMYSAVRELEAFDANVILVDTIGHLSSLYQYGTIAYIGGGFGKGIHNTLEAAAFGKPILFGPNYKSFQEAKDLISNGAAYVIEHHSEGLQRIEGIVNNPKERKSISQIAENYILKHAGATDNIVDFVFIKAD